MEGDLIEHAEAATKILALAVGYLCSIFLLDALNSNDES